MFQDKIIECLGCQKEFTWTAGEQEFYRDRGLSAPSRCKECREKRKKEKEKRERDRDAGY